MSQAQVKTNIDDQKLEDALASLKIACQAKKMAAKELEAAINNVISPALQSSILHKNCNGLNKIGAALKELSAAQADKVCMAIEKYFVNYLKMPVDAIIYIPALHKFSCNITPLLSWAKDNPDFTRIIEAMPLHTWLKEHKNKKQQSSTEALSKAAKNMIKIIESYRMENSAAWQEIYELLKNKIN